MKTLNKLMACGLLVLLTNCQSYFEKDPIGLLTPELVNTNPTINSVQFSVNSSYQMLSSTLNLIGNWGWADGTVTRNDFVLYDIGSDDAMKKWNPDGDQPWMEEVRTCSYIASNPAFIGMWSYFYEGVSRTNLALSYLTDDKTIALVGIDANLRKRLLSETYFLRAYYYFDLVINFGDVPLITQPINSFEDAYNVSQRVAAENIWTQISSDLAKAKENALVSKFSSTTEPWRVSLGAILAMQAKVALYRKEYEKVKTIINELEATSFYGLNSNYFQAFSIHHEFKDSEVIFAYNHQSKVTPGAGNGLCALLGWGFVAPSTSLINEFELNDPRKNYTFSVEKKAVFKILGDTTLVNQGNDDSPSNKVYIRYADVLLWKAEALIETGDLAGGIQIINNVRKRARNTTLFGSTEMAPAGTLPDRPTTTSKAEAFKWLIHERRVELGFESHRLKDLKRWGIAKQVLNDNGQGFTDRNYLFPIPQKEIDKSGKLLTQNKGY